MRKVGYIAVTVVLLLLLTSCIEGCTKGGAGGTSNLHQVAQDGEKERQSEQSDYEESKGFPNPKEADQNESRESREKSEMAVRLEAMGLVDVSLLDTTLLVEMVYATADNFMGEVLYGDLREPYLQPEVAEALLSAHRALKLLHPDYRFLIYDAARPISVQQQMRDVAVSRGKGYYVSNPANGGGLHNYGAAVDLTIVDQRGTPLPMGSGFDHFGVEANTNNEAALIAEGKIRQEELENRLLLRNLMVGAGFRTITSEWWHFNFCSRAEAIERYELINF